MKKSKSNPCMAVIVLFLFLLGIPGVLCAADLRIAANCSDPEDYYNNFKIRELSFRHDNGNPSIRIYARNKEKKPGIKWDPREWSRKVKIKIVKEELPANLVIRFEKGQAHEALSLYSTMSSLFHSGKLDIVRTCGGSVDTMIDEEISLTLQWGKEGSVRFW